MVQHISFTKLSSPISIQKNIIINGQKSSTTQHVNREKEKKSAIFRKKLAKNVLSM